MDDFTRVNTVYASFFGTSPPSRATVALDLPPGIRVRIDCLAFAGSTANHERQALHVQSQSYWAPANIGPYSQAILAEERLFISGQIGLIPSSITLPTPRSLAAETALSMQHVLRVVAALRNGWEGLTQAVVYWLADAGYVDAVRKAISVYDGDQVCEFPGDFYLTAQLDIFAQVSVKLLVAVKALPKGAQIEKQVVFHTGRVWIEEEDSESEIDTKKELVLKTVEPIFEQGNLVAGNLTLCWETSQLYGTENSAGCTLICLRNEGEAYTERDVVLLGTQLKAIRLLGRCFNGALSIRIFYTVTRVRRSTGSLIRSLLKCFNKDLPPVASVPSRYVATMAQDDWDFGLVVMN
ncbi:hypothetical protein GYMLUDRAFT_803453 [Collybiopsis luxurians FD-317 M1]|nr:hypothetical protein GYMLUDRAFT_803453 [Collybiopsis luxurians FD-317 M1]